MKSFLIVLYLIHIYLCQPFSEDIDDWEESDEIRMRAKASRKYIKTNEELELTKELPIIDAKLCNDVHPISVFIHSAGRSSGKYFDRRQVLRNTWVSEAKNLNISVFFAIALNLNESVNEELREESNKYQDMIQFPFIDAYHNLTLKAISILRWINRKCLTAKHILKTDDDVIVNTPYLLDNLSHLKRGFSGYVWRKLKVIRNTGSKWYMPYEYYPDDFYPDYVTGGAYIMIQNISHVLLKAIDSYSGYILDIDDAFIGIVAENKKIVRYKEPRIKWVGCNDVCALFDAYVVFQCKNISQSLEYWYKWKNTTYEKCFPGKPRTTTPITDMNIEKAKVIDESSNDLSILILVVIIILIFLLSLFVISYDLYLYFN